jgi:hypothetical protein
MNLNSPATLIVLHRANEIAKARRLALNTIYREAQDAATVEALRSAIDRVLLELAATEREAAAR